MWAYVHSNIRTAICCKFVGTNFELVGTNLPCFFHKIINLSDYTSVETLHFGRTLVIQMNKFFFKMFWPIESSILVLLSFGQN
jgi:hypothetical protein